MMRMDDNRLPSQAVHTLFPLFVCVYLSLVSIFAFLLCPSNPTTGCHKPNKRAAIVVVVDICDSSIYQLQLIYKLINLISCDHNHNHNARLLASVMNNINHHNTILR